MSDDEITNDAQLLAGLLGDRIGAEFGRRYMQFEFVRQYNTLKLEVASAQTFRGISWEQVFPDDVEESGLYIKLDVRKVPPSSRFHVVDPGYQNTKQLICGRILSTTPAKKRQNNAGANDPILIVRAFLEFSNQSDMHNGLMLINFTTSSGLSLATIDE
jgi:hypothetical protein